MAALSALALAAVLSAGGPDSAAPRLSFVQRQATVLGLVMEQASFRDAQRSLGPAEVRHNRGNGAGSAWFSCYAGRDGTTLVLEGSTQKGPGAVTSFQLVRDRALANFNVWGYAPPAEALPRCLSTRRLSANVATGGGVRLGMTCEEVARVVRARPERASDSECSFFLSDRERPVRDRDGSLIGHPGAWVTVVVKDGKAVAILASYSSVI